MSLATLAILGGIWISLLYSAAVMPASVWVIQVTVNRGWIHATAAASGVTLGQLPWCLAASLLLFTNAMFWRGIDPLLRAVLIAFLVWMAFRCWKANEVTTLKTAVPEGLGRLFHLSFIRSFLMPFRLASWAAFILSIGIHLRGPGMEAAALFSLGACVGQMIWHGHFIIVAGLFGHRVPEPVSLRSLNKLRLLAVVVNAGLALVMLAPVAFSPLDVMVYLVQLLVFVVLLTGGCRPGQDGNLPPQAGTLKLVAAYPIEAETLLEPSGLTMAGSTLFTIADKVDHTIYRIQLDGGVARLEPALHFDPPGQTPMDWEGLTAGPSGAFYLISERHGRLLRVDRKGLVAWASPDLRPDARGLGMFSKINAGFEGIARLGKNHWLGAVEREPRGLVEWQASATGIRTYPSVHSDSPFKAELPLLRLPDYSGLHADGQRIFALFRNAHLVVLLEKRKGSWREAAAWSYKHIETDPALAYRSQTYGQAEGLVVSGQDVYLIFDNNLGPRKADPSDRRPLLVHARFPAAGS